MSKGLWCFTNLRVKGLLRTSSPVETYIPLKVKWACSSFYLLWYWYLKALLCQSSGNRKVKKGLPPIGVMWKKFLDKAWVSKGTTFWNEYLKTIWEHLNEFEGAVFLCDLLAHWSECLVLFPWHTCNIRKPVFNLIKIDHSGGSSLLHCFKVCF